MFFVDNEGAGGNFAQDTDKSRIESRHPNNIVNCYLRAARGRGLETDIYEVAD